MCKLWKGVQKNIRKISIVDQFLMVFMLILFVYTIVQIFMGVAASQDDNTVGVIVRTSLASIFGYFISSNFAGGRSPSSSKPPASRVGAFPQNLQIPILPPA